MLFIISTSFCFRNKSGGKRDISDPTAFSKLASLIQTSHVKADSFILYLIKDKWRRKECASRLYGITRGIYTRLDVNVRGFLW